MAVCPSCQKGVGINAESCPSCGASLQIIPEPRTDAKKLDALKDDIEAFIGATAPEDTELALQQIQSWQPTVGDGPAEVVSSEADAEPVAIYDAPDETSARLVISLLETEGIDAMVMQHTVPMLDTSQQMLEGIWGQVFVHRRDIEQAREIIAAYSSDADVTPTEVA